jgi:hypothetical protein
MRIRHLAVLQTGTEQTDPLPNRGNRRLTGFKLSRSLLLPGPLPVRQIADKRKIVPARFIPDPVNFNTHKIEAHSPGKRFPLVNFNRRAVA